MIRRVEFPETQERFLEISTHFDKFNRKIGFDTHSIPEIWMKIQLGQMLLWEINDFESIFLTEIEQTYRGYVFWIAFGMGDCVYEKISSILIAFQNIAREYNCIEMKIYGRQGFNKPFKQAPIKWRRPFTVWTTEIK